MPNNNSFKSEQIELSLELVRMAQSRVRQHGVRLENELARQVAEAAVLAEPEELSLILDESATMSQSDVLSGTLGVNDIVVNGHSIDVRPLVELTAGSDTGAGNSGTISGPGVTIDRVLIGTPYLAHGSLVVRLDAGHPGRGKVVGYVTPSAWLKAEEAQKGSQFVEMAVQPEEVFEMGKKLTEITSKPSIKLPSMSRISDVKAEVGELVNNREKLISARQKQIFAYLSTNWTEETMATVESVTVGLSLAKVTKVLSDSVRWQARVEALVVKLSGRFPDLGKDEIRAAVLEAGERYGSQLTAPRYRRLLLAELVAKVVAKKTAKSSLAVPLARAQALAEKVLSGLPSIEAVKHSIGNQMAVDLAAVIHKQRRSANLSGLVAATAEELGLAYGQLALSPAYATHSQGEDSGLASVNEALALIEASQLAEDARAVEMDLADF